MSTPGGAARRSGDVGEEAAMLDAEALRAADAIDALLRDAMDVRAEAVKKYKQATREKESYEHALMYKKLHKLPKEKIDMYALVCKLRSEVAAVQEQARKSAALFASERKQLRDARDGEKQRAERAEKALGEAMMQTTQLQDSLHQARELAASAERKGREDTAREVAQRQRLEGELRRSLDEQRRAYKIQIASLQAQNDHLQVLVDEFRGEAQASKLCVMEMEVGLSSHARCKLACNQRRPGPFS